MENNISFIAVAIFDNIGASDPVFNAQYKIAQADLKKIRKNNLRIEEVRGSDDPYDPSPRMVRIVGQGGCVSSAFNTWDSVSVFHKLLTRFIPGMDYTIK